MAVLRAWQRAVRAFSAMDGERSGLAAVAASSGTFVDLQSLAIAYEEAGDLLGLLILVTWALFAVYVVSVQVSLHQVQIILIAMVKFAEFSFIFFGVLFGFTHAMYIVFRKDIYQFAPSAQFAPSLARGRTKRCARAISSWPR